jgi:flagellar biosynthetic protein FliQ
MEPQEVIDLSREAIKTCLFVGGPILLASLIVGMLVGAVQAMTQVPDQSVSFVPKLICLILLVGIALPWLTDRMLDYSREAFSTPISIRSVTTNLSSAPFRRTSNPSPINSEKPKQEVDNETPEPSKLPFQLPQYRFSRIPKANLEG